MADCSAHCCLVSSLTASKRSSASMLESGVLDDEFSDSGEASGEVCGDDSFDCSGVGEAFGSMETE